MQWSYGSRNLLLGTSAVWKPQETVRLRRVRVKLKLCTGHTFSQVFQGGHMVWST
jgi:hypothetical protein